MKKTWLFMSVLFLFVSGTSIAEQKCLTRNEFMDKHVVRYRAFDNTIRGCVVPASFYTQQHKMNRGRLKRGFIIELCEGEPKTSPRIGNSFEICPHEKKIQKGEKED
ncbi:hypothetical protein KKA14_00720 [bacterium]|nr:hypothetical protein [bacterium]